MPAVIAFQSLPLDQEEVIYSYGPDSFPDPAVESGHTIEVSLRDSAAFPGTTRRIWIHIPRGCDRTSASGLILFNDGWWYLDPDGEVRAGIVLDNLVAAGDIPMVVGVFVDPGNLVDSENPKNRNVEYDAFDSRYVDFLLDEVLPLVAEYCEISDNPALRVMCGGSSGGNAAFTAAWSNPDAFGCVIAFLSSFAQMPGGNPYPALIPAVSPKPLRIMMQAGHRDLGWNEAHDNWLAENLLVAAALAKSGYDFRLVLGDGGHSPNHGGVLLPDALRWALRPSRPRENR